MNLRCSLLALKEETAAKADNLTNAKEAVQVATEKMEAAGQRYRVEEARKADRVKLTESLIRLKDFFPAVSSLASKETALDVMKEKTIIWKKNLRKPLE